MKKENRQTDEAPESSGFRRVVDRKTVILAQRFIGMRFKHLPAHTDFGERRKTRLRGFEYFRNGFNRVRLLLLLLGHTAKTRVEGREVDPHLIRQERLKQVQVKHQNNQNGKDRPHDVVSANVNNLYRTRN